MLKRCPKRSASSEAQSSVHAAVAYKQPNRVVVLNSKIVRAVYDNNLIQADKDPTTGALYVVPLTKETDRNVCGDRIRSDTQHYALCLKERLTAQTVTLKESGTFSSFDGPSVPSELSSLPYEERIQTALKLIPQLRDSEGEALGGTLAGVYLHAQPVRAWNALGLRLERYRILNRTKHKQTVREPEFWRNGVLAVATEASDLAPGASARSLAGEVCKMSVKSFFESERRKKQIRGLLIIFGPVLCRHHDFLLTSLTARNLPRSLLRLTSSTQISMVPSKADYEQHQAIYNDRLLNLERESKEAKQREAKLQSDKKRLEDRIALLEKNAPRANRQTETAPSEDGWPPSEILGKQPISKKTGFTSGNPSQGRYSRQQSDAPVSSPAPRLVINNFGSVPNPSNALGTLAAKTKPETLSYLPSGTFAKARLLNGATAPTRGQGSGNPVPVLLELTDSAVMPNLYRSGIKRCFVTANATGELASERVLIRLDRLSCIDENGGAVDKKIQGLCFRRRRQDRSSCPLSHQERTSHCANALFTGTLAGLGKAVSLASENETTSITGTVSTTVTNPWKAGFGEGATHAMDRITDYYLRARQRHVPGPCSGFRTQCRDRDLKRHID